MSRNFNSSQILSMLMRNQYARYVIIAGLVLAIGYAVAQPKLNDWFGWNLPGLPGDQNRQAQVEQPDRNTTDPNATDPDLKAEQDYPADQTSRDRLPAEANGNTSSKQKTSSTTKQRPLGELIETRPRVFESTAGLLYGSGSKDGHRKAHVLTHAKDDPSRNQPHGVFDGGEQKVFAVLDEAYELVKKKDKRVRADTQGDRVVYEIDMRRKIGYVGGTVGKRQGYPEARYVRMVLEDRWVITAFPIKK